MLGSILGQCLEAEHDGKIYGMASRKLHEEMGKEIKSIEGIEKPIEKTRTLSEFLGEFIFGIRSACTYLNCLSYYDIYNQAEFITTGKGSLKSL